MKFYRIDQVDFISKPGEREGVGPGTAAYVKNYGRCRGQIPGQN